MKRTRFIAMLAAVLVLLGCAAAAGTSNAATGQTIFGTSTSGINTDPDTTKSTVGTQFRVAKAGTVDAIKVHRSAQITGALTGKVARGSTVLATVTLPAADAGWQVVDLPAPVSVVTGQTYTVYYTAPAGRYSVKSQSSWPRVSGDLTAVKGVYTFGSGVPSSVYQNENYFVDLVFNPTVVVPPTTSASPSPTTAPTTSEPPVTTTSEPTTPPVTTEPTTTAPTTTTTQPPSGGIVVLGRSFPDASTTGVPEDVKPSLTPYTGSCTITTADVIIDRKIINCDMRLLAPGIKITNTIINGTVFSDCCYLDGAYSLTDSEVHGPQAPVTVVGEARFSLLRVEVTGGSQSVRCNTYCDVRDSYIHGQYTDLRGIAHESGIRQDDHGTIIHNTITCDATPVPPDAGCSAAISGYGDFGTVNNNTITDNLIDGGPDGSMSYCVYGGSTQGKPYPNAHHIVVKDNIFRRGPGGKCGIYGPVTSFDSAAPGNVWSNNLWDDGSGQVPAAN